MNYEVTNSSDGNSIQPFNFGLCWFFIETQKKKKKRKQRVKLTIDEYSTFSLSI